MISAAHRAELIAFPGVRLDDEVPAARCSPLALGGGVALWLSGSSDPAALQRWGARRGVPVVVVEDGVVVLARVDGFGGLLVAPAPPLSAPTEPRAATVLRSTRKGQDAAALVARSGLAGLRLRSVRIDPTQPDRIEVLGDGDPRDAIELVEGVRARVEHDSGVLLASSLRLVGIEGPGTVAARRVARR